MNVPFFVVLAVLALVVVFVPIVTMAVSEHRNLHGTPDEHPPRRLRRGKVPIPDKIGTYTQTSQREFQDRL